METVKIHYLGFGVQELPTGSTIMDAVWHLGAKYGGTVYNAAFRDGIIRIDEVNRVVVVRPTINEYIDKAITSSK